MKYIYVMIFSILFINLFSNFANSNSLKKLYKIEIFKENQLDKTVKSLPIFGELISASELDNEMLLINEVKDNISITLKRTTKVFPSKKKSYKILLKNIEYLINFDKNLIQELNTPHEKKYVLNKIFDTNLFEKEKKVLETKINKISTELNKISKLNEKLNSEKNVQKNLFNTLKVKEKELAEKYSKLNQKLQDAKKTINTFKTKTLKTSMLQKELKAKSARILELKTLTSSLTQTLEYNKNEIENLKMKSDKAINAQANESNNLKKAQAQISKLNKIISNQKNEIQKFKPGKMEESLTTKEKDVNEITKLKKVVEVKNEKIKQLNKTITNNKANSKNKHSDESKKLKNIVNVKTKKIDELSLTIEDMETKYSKLQDKLKKANQKISSLSNTLSKKPNKASSDKSKILKERIKMLEVELNRAKFNIAQKTVQINSLTKKETKNTTNQKSKVQNYAPFKEMLIENTKTKVIEKMLWRKKIGYPGVIPIFLKSRNLLLITGSRFNFFDNKGKIVITLEGIKDTYYNSGYALSKDETIIAFEDGGEIHIFKVQDLLNKSLKPLTCFGHTRQVMTMNFFKNNQYLVSDSDDGTTRVFSLKNNECSEIKRYNLGKTALTDKGFAFTIENNLDKELVILKKIDLMTGQKAVIAKQSSRYDAKLRSYEKTRLLRYLSNSKKLVAFGSPIGVRANYDNLANLWLIDTENGITSFIKSDSKIGTAIRDKNLYDSSLAISSDQRYVAYMSGYTNNKVYIFDVKNRIEIHNFEAIDRDGKGIAFLPGSHTMIVHNNESSSWGGAVHYFGFK